MTYRALSRDQSLSVHAAKKYALLYACKGAQCSFNPSELSAFYTAAKARQDTLAATYIIIGTPKAVQPVSDTVDEDGYEVDEGEFQSELSLVVPENELEGVLPSMLLTQ